ncbi:GMC family oxidoreductase [Mycolicibacterium agri]|uniref:GMC family oxidoreductase n=1 Tax=Mycolicibacterium agri TaxID=36811 RepID=UPI001A9C3596|nr:GMC family oxidoreductase [Mycolicibacterium agri]
MATELTRPYDFIVCGAGTSGSVVARRLAEDPAVSVLLLEAGGDDDVPAVTEPDLWHTNLGGPRDWAFVAEPNANLNNRTLTLNTGRVLGGSSSINVMCWARGHRDDWDHFADESGHLAWSYAAVRDIYRRVEHWRGQCESAYRGRGGPMCVEPNTDAHPANRAAVEAAHVIGVEAFDHPNGALLEGPGGAAIADNIICNGKRRSAFRAYAYPIMDRPNLTVLTNAEVRRLRINRGRAVGVEASFRGRIREFTADCEVVLSMGAIHTPKILMLSGLGDAGRLRQLQIPVVAHLPGVGRNLQNHLAFSCIWEMPSRWPADPVGGSVMFWSRGDGKDSPEFFACQGALKLASPESIARFGLPETCFGIYGSLTHPRSRGIVELTGPAPDDPVRIHENALSDPHDLAQAATCIEDIREVGNAPELRPYFTREVMPGDLKGDELTRYLRDGAMTYWHQCGTAKMGRDSMSVVDGALKVYGIAGLRIADASVMPRITAGNTMAPCVVIGERAAEEIKRAHGLE